MFKIEGRENEAPKLPTLLKYLKTLDKDHPPVHKVVKIVWFPNKYPNFTFDTESFRIRLSSEGENASELTDFLEQAIEDGQVLCVHVADPSNPVYSIELLPDEEGEWEELGSTGFKCSVKEKRSNSKKRTSKKPVG